MPEISGGFCGCGAFSKPSWRTDPASHDSSPRLVSERCLTARRLSRINLTCFHLHYASTRSKHWSLLRELTSGQLGTTNPPEHPKAPNEKVPNLMQVRNYSDVLRHHMTWVAVSGFTT